MDEPDDMPTHARHQDRGVRTSDRFVTYGRLTEDETHEAVLTIDQHGQAKAANLARYIKLAAAGKRLFPEDET